MATFQATTTDRKVGRVNRLNQLWVITDAGPSFLMNLEMVVSTSHEWSNEITVHAVEEGASVSDHTRANPDAVSMDIFISNAPLEDERMVRRTYKLELPDIPGPAPFTPGAIEGAVTSFVSGIFTKPKSYSADLWVFDEDFDNVQDALDVLNGLRASGALLQLFTPKVSYDNMMIEKVSMSRARPDGSGASVTVSFKSVRIVQTRKTTAPDPATHLEGTATVSKGAQQPEEKDRLKSLMAHAGGEGSYTHLDKSIASP